jgi:hypothetical protein
LSNSHKRRAGRHRWGVSLIPGTLPTGVAVIEGANSASIAESIVKVYVPTKPNGYVYHVVMGLLFG